LSDVLTMDCKGGNQKPISLHAVPQGFL
jgi:hypothetical protein